MSETSDKPATKRATRSSANPSKTRRKAVPAKKRVTAAQKKWARRVEEWAGYDLAGGKDLVRSKRELLAQIEKHFSTTLACREADVLRWKFKQWKLEDLAFAEAVQEAENACHDVANGLMYKLATAGKTNLKALLIHLNAYSPMHGLYKKQLLERQIARWIDFVDRTIRGRVPDDIVDAVRTELIRGGKQASRLPSGRRLK